MPSASHELRRIRQELWNEDPHCHWCGVLTKIDHEGRATLDPDDATLDHIYHRGHEARKVDMPKQKEDVVLACSHCNNKRGTAWEYGCRFDPSIEGKIDYNSPWKD